MTFSVLVDVAFGKGTTKAVRAFELFQQRSVDGVVTRLDVLVLRDVVTNGGAVAKSAGTGGALPKNAAPPPKLPPETPPPVKLGPGMRATVGSDGYAVVPILAPPVVQQVIIAGNRIAKMPYIYGGGHGKWEDAGYDCSGSVSYALHGGGLLRSPLDSSSFMHWGYGGRGKWITVYTNPGHAYAYIAGLRLDTGMRSNAKGAAPGSGPRWNYGARSNRGFTARHPNGL